VSEHLTYAGYAHDERHMREYAEYQQRYAESIRESDKVLLELIRERLPRGGSLLDMGCSTGNLLLHLEHAAPGAELHGADLNETVIEAARRAPELDGIEFHVQDMLEPTLGRTFDVVVANAALMFFTPEELREALLSLARLVTPGGHLVAFDYFHPFDQEVELVERSAAFRDGLRFWFRAERRVREILEEAGLADPLFRPFEIPIDLPRPSDPADITTWTARTAEGTGMSFRGTIFQPWCHLAARRP